MLQAQLRSGIVVVREVMRAWLRGIADRGGILVHRFDYFLAVLMCLALLPELKQMPRLKSEKSGFDGCGAT